MKDKLMRELRTTKKDAEGCKETVQKIISELDEDDETAQLFWINYKLELADVIYRLGDMMNVMEKYKGKF